MKTSSKALLVLFGILLAVSVLAFPYRAKIKQKIKLTLNLVRMSGVENKCVGCSDKFNDKVSTHEQAYRSEGILPQQKDEELDILVANGTLVKLHSNKLYKVRELNFSMPYLLPKASSFADTLALLYKTKCQSNSIEYLPFTISSATRSVESINSLMKVNQNSIRKSAHLKGKTFDISYTAFNENQNHLKLFTDALHELQQEGRCYVKFELNGTLHVTVI